MRIDQLLARGPLITDGAWGTQFQLRGLTAGECADPWNLTRPDRVREVASAYVRAGSSVILTNTFNANRIALTRHSLTDKMAEINRAGARLSREAAKGKAYVFASMGPTGLMFLDDTVSELDLLSVFREQAAALKEGGADAIVIETMADLTEARLAVAAAKETNLPVVACMVFDLEREETGP
jgi:methionine synthase I (cobalamin-dependent)